MANKSVEIDSTTRLHILEQGGKPYEPKSLSEEEMLLYAAWSLGMSQGDVVHIKTIFSYVQTHIIPIRFEKVS